MSGALTPVRDHDSIADDFSTLALGTLDLKESAVELDETRSAATEDPELDEAWIAAVESRLDLPASGGPEGVQGYEPTVSDAHANLFGGLHVRRSSYLLFHYGVNPQSPHVCHLPGCDKPGFVETSKPAQPGYRYYRYCGANHAVKHTVMIARVSGRSGSFGEAAETFFSQSVAGAQEAKGGDDSCMVRGCFNMVMKGVRGSQHEFCCLTHAAAHKAMSPLATSVRSATAAQGNGGGSCGGGSDVPGPEMTNHGSRHSPGVNTDSAQSAKPFDQRNLPQTPADVNADATTFADGADSVTEGDDPPFVPPVQLPSSLLGARSLPHAPVVPEVAAFSLRDEAQKAADVEHDRTAKLVAAGAW